MNRDLRNRLKERWGKLTDHDLDLVDGQAALLLIVLQEKYGYARHAAEQELLHFLDESLLWVERRQGRTVAQRSGPRGATAIAAPRAGADSVYVRQAPRRLALALRLESLPLTPP